MAQETRSSAAIIILAPIGIHPVLIGQQFKEMKLLRSKTKLPKWVTSGN